MTSPTTDSPRNPSPGRRGDTAAGPADTGPGGCRTARRTAPGGPDGLDGVTDLTEVAPADARALSGPLFDRLATLEEGTPEYSYVRNTLVELNLTLVRHAAGRLPVRRESWEDVLQVGTVGLIKAINRFDPSRGVEFTTYALPTITGEIKRYFRDNVWAVRVPRRLQELRQTLRSAGSALEQDLGRTPTCSELAEHLGLDAAEVDRGLRAANGYRAASLDAPVDDGEAADALADHVRFDDVELERVEDLTALGPLLAALPERERTILTLRFVHDMSQSRIGAELGISQMHVSRLLRRALSRLRTELTRD
ncbi:SigB/SigF/SigG family RNA polymerase sigma factor [Streptomyces sp. HNM0645]|uniref:SigB/SigF/SigG family RNA polymerase sigma factor n=1 Tax=Streptomyces sp. HNM0645 TaxID=2782343 RepID=UPI0024B6E0C8|nr:SigB/SigF/SigG family RNA polymerase sigma factor [Streptomyces sp. HNM0645]MDI9884446.1 SigB/SigF/SigG family RNA polymerase sigma factor [Streptomyces sp. HNM0645]